MSLWPCISTFSYYVENLHRRFQPPVYTSIFFILTTIQKLMVMYLGNDPKHVICRVYYLERNRRRPMSHIFQVSRLVDLNFCFLDRFTWCLCYGSLVENKLKTSFL